MYELGHCGNAVCVSEQQRHQLRAALHCLGTDSFVE